MANESIGSMLDQIEFVYSNGSPHKLYGAKAVEASLIDTIQLLQKNGTKQVYIILPFPECSVNIPKAATFASLLYDDSEINSIIGVSHNEYRERNKEALAILHTIANKFDCVTLIDPTEIFFPDGDKSIVVQEGKSLYFDDDHLSKAGARLLKPLISQLKPFTKDN